MNVQGQNFSVSLPLASRVVLETNDLLAARDHLSQFLWSHSVIPKERRPRVAFRHCTANIGRISLNVLHYGAAVTIDAYPEEDSYLFLVLLRGSGEMSQGKFTGPIGPDIVRAINPTSTVQMKFSPGEANLTVRVPAQLLNEFIREETGRPVTSPIEFEHVRDASAANAPGLRRWLHYFCSESERRARGLETKLVRRQMERALLSLMLTQIPHNYSDVLGHEPLGAAPEYIRLVEDYLHSHATQPLSLRDLAGVAEVSERTLQSGFRKFRNTTPMEFLRDYRLELALEDLEKAALNGRTVTEIALGCGFNHPGKFAKCYRERFGESPSETRKRKIS